jgi:hypothetical protein
VVEIDTNYTPDKAALAIINAYNSFPLNAKDSTGLSGLGFRVGRYPFEAPVEWHKWAKQNVAAAARQASVLAEVYINGLASLTTAGGIVVTAGDIADNKFSWHHLLVAVPLMVHLPRAINGLKIKVAKTGEELSLARTEVEALSKLSPAEQELLVAEAAAAKTPAEAKAILSRSNNVVYRSLNEAGDVIYVGITNNFARRAAAHLQSRGLQIVPLLKGLSRSDARAVEQVLIEIHQLGARGGTLLNKINAIAKTNPTFADQLRRGLQLLQSIGYRPGM